jgi:hypothetical protein
VGDEWLLLILNLKENCHEKIPRNDITYCIMLQEADAIICLSFRYRRAIVRTVPAHPQWSPMRKTHRSVSQTCPLRRGHDKVDAPSRRIGALLASISERR